MGTTTRTMGSYRRPSWATRFASTPTPARVQLRQYLYAVRTDRPSRDGGGSLPSYRGLVGHAGNKYGVAKRHVVVQVVIRTEFFHKIEKKKTAERSSSHRHPHLYHWCKAGKARGGSDKTPYSQSDITPQHLMSSQVRPFRIVNL